MKSFVATVTVLGLLATSSTALAQPDHNRPEQGARPAGGQAPNRPSGPQGGGGHAGPAPERGAGAQNPGRGAGEQNPGRAPGQPSDRGGRGQGQQSAGRAPTPATSPANRPADQTARRATHSPPSTAQGPGPGAGAGGNRAGTASRAAPSAGGRATARSPSVAALRGNVQAPRRFSAGAYRQPQGYSYRRWGYGDRLPPAYFGRSYWLTNFLAYGLFGPPPGLVWIRVGPDALLIDEYSGEVVRAEYGVFY
ncbi:RcnB family protein [Phenylobacterium sp.]|uniref:RcnB family protein n=1 Tax=Phenylobacterium sp. TaxID=1871053 RepID=UPI0025E26343|nr:RcnB family protein [Phenylobacterium sp.]